MAQKALLDVAAARSSKQVDIVTGATSGIGYAIAYGLANQGSSATTQQANDENEAPLLILGARDVTSARAQQSKQSLERSGCQVSLMPLDLADLRSVQEFAQQINTSGLHVRSLCHNAGVVPTERSVTGDGHELAFQVHTLSPHVLTQKLKPAMHLQAQACNAQLGSVRVVYVGSRLEKRGQLLHELEKPAMQRFQLDDGAYSYMRAYATSKQAATATMYEHAQRIGTAQSHEGVDDALRSAAVVNVCSPGVVNTRLARGFPFWQRALSLPLRYALLRSPSAGASTPLWLLTSNDDAALTTGAYFLNKQQIKSSEPTYDPSVRTKVWDTLEAIWQEDHNDQN